LLLALKRCTSAQRDAVGALLKSLARSQAMHSADAHDLEPALELVRRHRGVEDSVRRAEEHAERARSAIAPFSDSRAKRDLIAAAEYAVARDR
jgi:geranylgeranyl pyrophosphate synthase